MKVIVCIDDNNGMQFNHRRQSRDRIVIDDILDCIGNDTLYISPYSLELFKDSDGNNIKISDSFLNNAKTHDYCFVEDKKLLPYIDKIDEIIIYRWNRVYPADLYFDIDLTGWRRINSLELHGYSHEKITKEIFAK